MANDRKIKLNAFDIKILKLITDPEKIKPTDNEIRFNADTISTKLKEEKIDAKQYAIYSSLNHLVEEKLIVKIGKAKIGSKRPTMIFKLDEEALRSAKDKIKEVKKRLPPRPKKKESMDSKMEKLEEIRVDYVQAGKRISQQVDKIDEVKRKKWQLEKEIDEIISGKMSRKTRKK